MVPVTACFSCIARGPAVVWASRLYWQRSFVGGADQEVGLVGAGAAEVHAV